MKWSTVEAYALIGFGLWWVAACCAVLRYLRG